MQRATFWVDKAQGALLLPSTPKPSRPKACEAQGVFVPSTPIPGMERCAYTGWERHLSSQNAHEMLAAPGPGYFACREIPG